MDRDRRGARRRRVRIAKAGRTDQATLRNAVLYGSALASFCVERFGPARLESLKMSEVEERVHAFRDLTRVEELPTR